MQEQVSFLVDQAKIHCEGCEQRIGAALRQIPGVTDVRASAQTQRVEVQLDSARVSPDAIAAKLSDIGFPAGRG